ncbi:MAG: hypothetical protein M3438_05370 [Pseudomonadota bacterium]|nr:hypothetical protein [Sphingomonas sp.]MDQ3478574.1 hypothetical protein [Pseudomonadota bacterium]
MSDNVITDAEIEGFRSLEFDLPTALLQQIIAEFERMESASLLPDHTLAIPDAQEFISSFMPGSSCTLARLTAMQVSGADSLDTPGRSKADIVLMLQR